MHEKTTRPGDTNLGTIHAESSLVSLYESADGQRWFVSNVDIMLKRELHARQNLSLEKLKQEVATRSQCSIETIDAILKNQKAPALKEASRISGYFKLSLRTMLRPDLKERTERQYNFAKPVHR